jgi:hypothetical protein
VLTQPVAGFGHALALDGETLLVGACSAPVTRAVFVYARGLAGWTLQTVLQPSSALPILDFGGQLALEGDTAVVGGHLGTGSTFRAALFVFQRQGEKWSPTARLTPDGTSSPSLLADLDLDGDRIVSSVSTPAGAGLFASERKGAGWRAFERIPVVLGGRVHKLFPECALALAGGTLAAVTPPEYDGVEERRRSVVLERVDPTWTPARILGFPEDQVFDGFGTSLAVEGSRVAVGAPYRTHLGLPTGVVYVYELVPPAAVVPAGPRASRKP